MFNVFIDGSAGTTGLKIVDRLSKRSDINLIKLPEELRKDINARKDALNSADVAFLCLPDSAAIEAVSLIESDKVKVIDTSTAHRTNNDWQYGFAELEGMREKISCSKRIANPGCHASGFIALVYPLVEAGVLSKSENLSCFSLTGYSGGGKKMIAEYEDAERDVLLDAPRQYGLTQQHKHLKEMKAISKIENAPVFCPVVAPFYSGMEVTVPIFKSMLKDGTTLDDIKNIYKEKYNGPIVNFVEGNDEAGFISANAYSDLDSMEIAVFGNEDRIILTARYDNLGKGASGAAIECLNIVLGQDETTGLAVK